MSDYMIVKLPVNSDRIPQVHKTVERLQKTKKAFRFFENETLMGTPLGQKCSERESFLPLVTIIDSKYVPASGSGTAFGIGPEKAETYLLTFSITLSFVCRETKPSQSSWGPGMFYTSLAFVMHELQKAAGLPVLEGANMIIGGEGRYVGS